MAGRAAPLALAALLAAPLASAAPAYTAAIGYERLVAEFGEDVPTGHGVSVAQVEPPSGDDAPRVGPDRGHRNLSDVRLHAPRGHVAWGSRHATSVANLFYGRGRSIAPGIRDVEVYAAADFIRMVAGWRQLPAAARSGARVWNHSWVGGAGPHVASVLARFDAVAHEEDWIVVCGVRNKGNNDPYLASAYNAIAVGMSNGRHAKGAAHVNSAYNSGRTRPHLVAPMNTSSASVPLVSAAAALLLEAGTDPLLSRDRASTIGGRRLYNAQRASVVKAALLAGASRTAIPLTAIEGETPPAWRERAAHRTDNGLDRRFGAGQLDVDNSYRIVAGGEFNSRQDQPGDALLASAGFDFDPAFGGLDDSNGSATYELVAAADGRLAVALVWPVTPDTHAPANTRVHDLALTLLDGTDGERRVAHADGRSDNDEHLYAPVKADHRYRIVVGRALDQAPFASEYALAWRIETD